MKSVVDPCIIHLLTLIFCEPDTESVKTCRMLCPPEVNSLVGKKPDILRIHFHDVKSVRLLGQQASCQYILFLVNKNMSFVASALKDALDYIICDQSTHPKLPHFVRLKSPFRKVIICPIPESPSRLLLKPTQITEPQRGV